MADLSSQVFAVIGSGPAGLAAAEALLARGKRVLMLDVGFEASGARLAAPASVRGIERKLNFGSDHMYRLPTKFPALTRNQTSLEPSFAFGGFSTVWGCSVLPYRQTDLAGWPIGLSDLESHYSAVVSSARLAGARDELTSEFPLYHNQISDFPFSRQARSLRSSLDGARENLKAQGIRSGAARIMLNASTPECVRCGLCLSGCPTNVLFNSNTALTRLRANPLFEYRKFFVTSFSEKVSSVVVSGYPIHDEKFAAETEHIEVARLFMAGGVLPTLALTLESLGETERSVTLLDSQYFLQPVLISRHRADVLREDLATFAQLFIEIENAKVDSHNVHLQVYTYNSLIAEAVQSKLPFSLKLIPESVRSQWLGRLAVIQGYLHSDSSSKLRARLTRGKLQIDAEINSQTPKTIRSAMRLLSQNAGATGLQPLPGMLEITQPGRGFHSGGSLPMHASPTQAESDRYGRPFGLKRVHAVDASVFPTIPAATITLTVMANAHRIASENYDA